LGNLVTEEDENHAKTTYQYDDLNRLVLVTQPDPTTPLAGGAQWQTTYDNLGRVAETIAPGNRHTTYEYDRRDRVKGILGPDPGDGRPATTYTYDKVGNLLTTTDPLNHATEYTYDALDRLTSTTQWRSNCEGPGLADSGGGEIMSL
jgi:YD repeat-containing protein